MTDRTGLPSKIVRGLWRRVALLLGLAALAGIASIAGGTLAAGAWLGGLAGWERPSPLPLALWSLALLAILVWVGFLLRRFRAWNTRTAAAEIESNRNWPRGTVEGAVEPGIERPGISSSLVAWQRSWLAQQLGGSGIGRLGARRTAVARRDAVLSFAAALVLVSLSVLAWRSAPERTMAAWLELGHPIRHLQSPPLPPIAIRVETERLRRGEDLRLVVEAPVRDSVLVAWQQAGEPLSERWYALSSGRADGLVPRVEAVTELWARAPDGALSDTLTITPFDPLMLLDVEIALDYPGYTGRPDEVYRAPLPVVTAPVGTQARLTAKTTLPVGRAALRSGDGGREISLTPQEGRLSRGQFRVTDGTFGWEIEGAAGETLEGEPDSIRFFTIPDSVPRVQLTYPGTDTTLPIEMIQQLMVDVRDDYGISRVELVSWRVSERGERWPDQVQPIPLTDEGRRANLTTALDARGRGFFPGDTLRYYVRAYDNAPTPQMGKSREYVLRLPSLEEVRDQSVADARGLVEEARQLAEQARVHEESSQALERSAAADPAARTQDGRTEGSAVDFGETEAARKALDEAGKLLEDAREVQEALGELREAIEQSGLADSTVLERLREIESLYRRVLTPELERRLENLRDALANLDPERIREAVRELAQGSVDFRERVEQSVELLRRAALEQEFGMLESRAQELVEEQERLLNATSDPDSSARNIERRAERLSSEVDSLAQKIENLASELNEAEETESGERASRAGESAGEASEADRQVARSMPSRPSRAMESAREALQRMQDAASALQEGRENMQQRWREEVVEALERSRAEAMELARRQEGINEQLGRGEDPREQSGLRSEEVALKRALDQLQEQLSRSAQSSLLVDPALQGLAEQVGESMQRLLNELTDGTRRRQISPGLGEQVSEGLNELAYRLMQAAEGAASAQSGTGFQEALEQLAQLAEQQGELNAQAGGMTPGLLSEALAGRLQEMAARQREIGQRLQNLDRSMGARGQVLGRLDAMAREADDIARNLERGRIDEQLVERQERLFQRLLDAGRTLERDEFEKERRAERPSDVEVFRPDELPPEMLLGPRYPHPGTGDLRPFPPVLRQLILQYFDLLNRQEGSRDDT